MADNEKSSIDPEFGTAGRTPSPLGGGGTTNIGGGTSGAVQGNADTTRNPASPIDDITATDTIGDNISVAGGISDRDDPSLEDRSRTNR